MKRTFMSLFVAAAVLGGGAAIAEAKTRVNVYFGAPVYDYQVGPGYIYNPNYGWYDSRYRDRFQNRYPMRVGLSCNAARNAVRDRGFRNVAVIECQGRTYTFEASRRGNRFPVYVNSRTGAVWRD